MTIPLISVIIPMKNEELFIRECLDSISSQSTIGFELEVIVIDDHSTDASFGECQMKAKADSRFKVFKNSGRGIIDALNDGYMKCSGQFITRMDADDIMPPNKLEALYTLLKNRPDVDVATGLVSYFSTGKTLGEGYVNYAEWLNNVAINNGFYDEVYKECTVASPNWLCRRSVFEQVGAFHGLQYPEDYDLVFRWKSANVRIGATNTTTHFWRDHNERASRNDENYADNRFLDLKISRFLAEDRDSEKSLILIGAGKKGKNVARILNSSNVRFEWLSNNPKKVGHEIYGAIIKDIDSKQFLDAYQLLIALSAPADITGIKHFLSTKEMVKASDCFYLF